jgi:prophage tail gpP-like protein
VVTGSIESLSISGSSTDHTISLEGRDNTSDILDSTLGDMANFASTISLKTLCEGLIAHLRGKGDTRIKVVDDTGNSILPFTKSEDLTRPDPGEAAFDFLQKWARKRQVLLTSDGDGNLLLTKPIAATEQTSKKNFLKHTEDGENNNVLSYSATYNAADRYNKYIVISQLDPTVSTSENQSNEDVVEQKSKPEFDGWGQKTKGRQLVLTAETPASEGNNLTRAQWERNIRKYRGNSYSCSVAGYTNQSGEVWGPGDLVYVQDDFAGVNDHMRINSVNFTLGSDGSKSNIDLVSPVMYTLELNDPNQLGEGYTTNEEDEAEDEE